MLYYLQNNTESIVFSFLLLCRFNRGWKVPMIDSSHDVREFNVLEGR